MRAGESTRHFFKSDVQFSAAVKGCDGPPSPMPGLNHSPYDLFEIARQIGLGVAQDFNDGPAIGK